MQQDILRVIVAVLLIINYLWALSLIFFERKRPSTIIAWALLLVLLPVIGLLIYLMFGSGLRFKKKRHFDLKTERDDRYQKNILEALKLSGPDRPYGFVALREWQSRHRKRIAQHSMDDPTLLEDMAGAAAGVAESLTHIDHYYTSIVQYFYNTDLSLYTDDNHVDIFTEGEKFFTQFFSDIDKAESSIHLLYYMIKKDDTGRELVDRLTKKAAEGVEVRVVYDSLGSLFSSSRMFKKLREAGGKVAVFFPLTFTFTSYLRLNYRNHRKIAVIDGRIGYVGGMNIGDEYNGRLKEMVWRDTHLRIQGTSVLFLQERFFMDWFDACAEEDSLDLAVSRYYFLPEPQGSTAMQIVSSGPDTANEEIKCGLIKMIGGAKEYVYLQTPYFIPDESFAEALKIAALSGTDVRLMLPRIPDWRFLYYTSLSYVDDLLKAGVKVYLYEGFLHAKTAVADDKIATVGTTNLDIRSFLLGFEVNAFIYDEKFAKQCKEIFLHDQDGSFPVTVQWREDRSILAKMAEGVLRIFSPIM